MRFRLIRAAPIELRLRWSGESEAAADWVLVVFADRPEPEWSFAATELPHRLGERLDPAAQSRVVGYADAGESLRTDLLTGPVRSGCIRPDATGSGSASARPLRSAGPSFGSP